MIAELSQATNSMPWVSNISKGRSLLGDTCLRCRVVKEKGEYPDTLHQHVLLHIHGCAGFWFQIQEAAERSRIAKTSGEPVNDETPLPVQVQSNQNQKLKLHQRLHHKSLACLCNSGLAEPEHLPEKCCKNTPGSIQRGRQAKQWINGNKTGIKHRAGFRGISTSTTKLVHFLPHFMQATRSTSTQSKCIHKSLKATKLL